MYRAIGLPTTCDKCVLSSTRSLPIWGQSEIPLTYVKGIIISAYSGKEEQREKRVLVEATNYLNAGGFLRKAMRSITKDKEVDRQIFFTNALSCVINKLEKKKLQECIESCFNWTQYEISKCTASCPILVTGSEAVTQLFGKKATITGLRNEPNLLFQDHPCIVTWNPITALRYYPKDDNGNYIQPVPPLSSTYLFKQDLIRFLKLANLYNT